MASKSLLCPIGSSELDIKRAIDETENYAVYEKMAKKDTLHMRLLAEELLGMIGSVLEVQEGLYWIEKNDAGYELHLKAEAPIGEKAKGVLIKASSDNANAAYKGVKGKIYQALDVMTQPSDLSMPIYSGMCGIDGIPVFDFTNYEWSFQLFEQQQKREQMAEDWDEMELSVLKKLTKDIIVSVRPLTVEITLKTK